MTACALPVTGQVFLGRDNPITLVLFGDGAVLSDLSGVTRVTVDFDGGATVIDSDTAPAGTIWWTDAKSWRGQTVDVLRLKLGAESIVAGDYADVVIVVYDATYPNGLRLEAPVQIEVVAA